MLEESISIWASMNSWLTPAVFFVLLNLMIGTIFVSSRLATQKPGDQHQEQEKHVQAQYGHGYQLIRSPSVLQRLKSISLCSYRSQEPTTVNVEKPQDSDQRFTFHQQTSQQDYQYHQNQNQPTISSSPSMLQKIKSSNLYSYSSQESFNPTSTKTHENQESTPTHFNSQQIYTQIQEHDERLQAEEEEDGFQDEENEQVQDQEQPFEEIDSTLQGSKLSKSISDTKPTSGEVPKKLPKKMRKSASAKSVFSNFEEEDIVESRRPATVKEGKTTTEVGDTEVDAKADDFIYKFKQQLKLQRVDSIIRYKDMITGGS
ncbi:PREDICTED: interaptin [Populus euphratica]|uniref:Interaptin n=1 Tax=Populus euphratica TaxID=75702 RepID=A0AAJ6TZA4_POPEU|nr:PREDICTED: interaptin [Populus euphratica]